MVQTPTLAKTQAPKGVSELLEQAKQILENEPQTAAALATEAYQLAVRKADHKGKADALLLLGLTSEKRADLEPARDYLIQAANLFKQVQEPGQQQKCLAYAGRVCRIAGELDRAKELLDQSLELAEQQGDSRAKAEVLNNIAGILYTKGEHLEALQVMEKVLMAHKEAVNLQGYHVALGNVALLHLRLGEYPQALEKLFEVYGFYKQNSDTQWEAWALNSIGSAYEEAQDFAKAVEYYQQALEVVRTNGFRALEVVLLNGLGSVYNQLGKHQIALDYLSRGLLLAQQSGYQPQEILALNNLGNAYIGLDKYQDAVKVYLKAQQLSEDMGSFQNALKAGLALGNLYLSQGQPEQALGFLEKSLMQAQKSGSKKVVYEAHNLLAQLHEKIGDYLKALEHQRQFHKIEREVFNQESEQRTRNLTLRFDLDKAQRQAEYFRLQSEVEHKAKEQAEILVLQRTIQLEETQIEMLQRLARAAEYRDDDTGEHIKRVGENAALIAREMGWPETRIEILKKAATLHDLGKIGISDALLFKPGKYTDEERESMKVHTKIGAEILAGGRSELMRMAEAIALTHHERWDGKGYPKGIAGEEIPEAGRIVSVADVFDALTSVRPYKKAWSLEDALAEIEKNAGTQFDPSIVKIALRVFKK